MIWLLLAGLIGLQVLEWIMEDRSKKRQVKEIQEFYAAMCKDAPLSEEQKEGGS